jgi:prepilin signal peptidase PulO-like enzyme (type II secretory pathway)
MAPQDLLLIAVLSFPLLGATRAVKDLTSFTIPNWIIPGAGGGLVPGGRGGLRRRRARKRAAVCLGVGVAALIGGMFMFALRWIGGGDAKLMAAGALWAGRAGLAPFLLWTTLAGRRAHPDADRRPPARARLRGETGPEAEHWVGRLMDRKATSPTASPSAWAR